MATQFQKDQDYYINQNLGATNKLIKDKQTANTNMSNKYVAEQNAIVDKAITNSVNKVQGEIDKLPTAYQSSFDANAVQQKINERQVAERMANMGLTDSGLNRTQQTAINIQRSNADAALRQQMNAATASLKQQIADLYASGESQKADISSKARYELEQKNQSVYNTYMDNLYSKANAYAENEANNRAAIEKARIEAQQKQQEQYVKWALENGYGYDKDGNLVYTGKIKTTDGTYVDIEDEGKSGSSKGIMPTSAQYDEILNLWVINEGYKDYDKFAKAVKAKYPNLDTDAIVNFTETFTLLNDGGDNHGDWFLGWWGDGGVDQDGSISYGENSTITMDDLYTRLKDLGYSWQDAKKMVKNFQHHMGI